VGVAADTLNEIGGGLVVNWSRNCSYLMFLLLALVGFLSSQPVGAQDVGSSLDVELSRAYGYYNGQKLSVQRVINQFPALASSASLAQMEFDLLFKSSYKNIEKELRGLLQQHWLAYKKNMTRELTKSLGSPSISQAQADTFIQALHLRAKGKIESPILETLLSYNPEFHNNPSKEFLRGFKSTFRTIGHPKAKGVDFQVEYPKSWRAKEGKRPNVIQLFRSKNGRGFESILLMVKDIPLPPGYKISNQELDEFFSPQALREMVPNGASFISGQSIILDNQKGGMMVFKQTMQRLSTEVSFKIMQFTTIYQNKIIFIQCSVTTKEANQSALSKRFKQLKPLFMLVANSFVLQSQY
jgi:hypothetical protein